MQQVLVPICIIGIITLGIYRLFELFVRRNERMAIIEKLQSNVDPSVFANKFSLPILGGQPQVKLSSSWPLRASLLLVGVGLGLLVAFFLELALTNSLSPEFASYDYAVRDNIKDSVAIIYLASVSLFGGLGLLIAYLVEQKKEKLHKD
ncbi:MULTISPECIES: DUF6249 domain-containing protein [unclassified Dysgonomonas]|uniref:DUF6249 domain-containing protein n=1 Tax=unclassified Dysgonomonas TaxID=2630389 RepID=UPI0006831B9D|nr:MULTISPECIES: DUF6249 domain-containing protein [unclassified Dysgonomonas]MBD8346498.1 hypothetical protein [Dysgonomonas sp. HGC4]MBF0574585.1 hypothetical protein [Dysgonomonas sp. GY617]